MTQTARPSEQMQFAHSDGSSAGVSPWKRIFRIIRWTTYTFAIVTLVLLFHKVRPPLVETSPQAAARAEEKFERVERAVASGQPATLRMDETELNSYLSSHLALEGKSAPKLGRFSVPAARRSRQTCDSGTNGSISAIGIAGSRPVMSR